MSSRSLTLISASSTHSRCRPQEIVSYSWVGNNSRVIKQFPWSVLSSFPLFSNGNTYWIINRPVTQSRSCQHKFKATLSTVTRYELTHALRSVIFPFRPPTCPNSFQMSNWRPKQQPLSTQPHNCSTHKIARCYKIYARFAKPSFNKLVNCPTTPISARIPIRPD